MGYLGLPTRILESPLLTYRLTWRIGADCVDHLVVAHSAAEARVISIEELQAALGRLFDPSQLEDVA